MNDPTHPIPGPSFSGKNLSDIPVFLEVESYGVAEWTPERDGKGKPQAVMVYLNLAGRFEGVQFGIRLKSRAECNRLSALVGQYRDMVWPR